MISMQTVPDCSKAALQGIIRDRADPESVIHNAAYQNIARPDDRVAHGNVGVAGHGQHAVGKGVVHGVTKQQKGGRSLCGRIL